MYAASSWYDRLHHQSCRVEFLNSGLELNRLGRLFRISEVLTNLGKNNLNNFTFSCCHAVTSCGKVLLPKKAGLRQDEIPKNNFPIYTENPHPPLRQADEVGAKEEEEDNRLMLLPLW